MTFEIYYLYAGFIIQDDKVYNFWKSINLIHCQTLCYNLAFHSIPHGLSMLYAVALSMFVFARIHNKVFKMYWMIICVKIMYKLCRRKFVKRNVSYCIGNCRISWPENTGYNSPQGWEQNQIINLLVSIRAMCALILLHCNNPLSFHFCVLFAKFSRLPAIIYVSL